METKDNLFNNFNYDYIEFYVGMAKMVAYWHVHALGFKVIAYRGPETGSGDRLSYYLEKNNIKLVITSAAKPGAHDILSFIDLHGNGIKRIAVKVDHVEKFYTQAIHNGAISIEEPHELKDDSGTLYKAAIKAFDDNEIVMINYDDYKGNFMPGYKNVEKEWVMDGGEDSYLENIDHIACALRENETKLWEPYFNKIFNSTTVQEFGKESITTAKSGLYLKVLQSENQKWQNVLVEPVNKKGKSQVQTFIDTNYGAGIQHIAFSSLDIFKSVELLRRKGVKLTSYPDSYYDTLRKKHPQLDVDKLQKHQLLCDVLEDTFLLQTFTESIGDRPTLFYEIVQRVNNYSGFGLGNINALFEAVEIEMLNKEE